MGTSSKFICVCNVGFEGENCENESKIKTITFKPFELPTTKKSSVTSKSDHSERPSKQRQEENDNEFETLSEQKPIHDIEDENLNVEEPSRHLRDFHKFDRRK